MTTTRTWRVDNLDCATCASELEVALSKQDGVAEATVNFLGKTMTVHSLAGESERFWSNIEHAAQRAEPTASFTLFTDESERRVWSFSGIDCPSCAAGVEEALRAKEGVASAHVDFAAQKITITSHGLREQAFFDFLIEEAQRLEPSMAVTAYREATIEHSPFLQPRLYRIIAAVAAFGVAMAFNFPLLYLISYAIAGYDVLYKAFRNILSGKLFDEYFLMSIATIGALIIGERGEAAAVMLFYLIGEYFQQSAVIQSRRSLLSALGLKVEQSRIVEGESVRLVKSGEVAVGSTIRVLAGEKIPLDGVILTGESELDMRSLTGESLPQFKTAGDEVFSSSLNLSGSLDIQTTRLWEESTASKILHLVEESSAKKAQSERFITTFARYYTPAVVALALALAVIPSLITGMWQTWIYRALVFLVVSCPCALVISVPLSYFAGIGKSARSGIIVKGGNFLEALKSLDAVVFDKTGTLTSGDFTIDSIAVDESGSYDKAYLIDLVSSLERHSNHPLSRAFDEYPAPYEATDVTVIAGKGVVGTVNEKRIAAGNKALFRELSIPVSATLGDGATILMAVNSVHCASFTLFDAPKAEASSLIAALRNRGVKHIAMISGDSVENANRVGAQLGLDEVHGALLPHQKQEEVLRLSRTWPNLAFIGDGINDAPSLAASKVGISIGKGASDLAIESADVVILSDDLSRVTTLLGVASSTGAIVRQNIIFALAIKALALLFGALGLATMWIAVIADTGVTILAVLNALRILVRRKSR